MEFKTTMETIPTSEVIYSGVQEQSVELDYILPDTTLTSSDWSDVSFRL